MAPTILHVDMDAFYASVEQRDRPELRGKPVIIGAPPHARGVVSAASYEARVFGVHSAMPSREAGRLCPQGVFLPCDMPRYVRASRQVFKIFEQFTPLVEPLSIDEAFLDVTGARRLYGDGPAIARKIKEEIRRQTGLTASVGVAPNKFLAKLASDLGKPDGLTIVPRARKAIMDLLAPLPVGRLWGVGKVTQETLHAAGLRTIGDIQNAGEKKLAAVAGAHAAAHLYRLALGEDARAMELDWLEKSISREHTFDRDCAHRDSLESTLLYLVEDVGRQLREDGRLAGTARIKVRWKNFHTITRQMHLQTPCRDDAHLWAAARELWLPIRLEQPVRLLGFGVTDLKSASAAGQLSLFDQSDAATRRMEQLSQAVDRIRTRFGKASLRRARTMGKSGG